MVIYKEKQDKYLYISLPIMLLDNAIGAVHSHQDISALRYLVNLLIVILCKSIGPLPGVMIFKLFFKNIFNNLEK